MKKNHVFGYYKSNVWRKTLKVMKLTSILILLAVFSVAAEGFGQGGTISMKMEDVSLKQVFQELKLHSDYTFVYSEKSIAGIEVEFLEVNDANLDVVMTECLKNTDLEYYVENNVVVIRKKAPVVIEEVKQEKKEIKGQVTDEYGETLPGVSVVIKGTTYGVSTDIDGNYKLLIPEMGGVIVFSFVGMVSKEVKIKNQTTIDVIMKSDLSKLNEVVVTGYQTLSKERVTGSFAIMKSDVIEKVTSVDLTENLEGKVSGLVISEEGEIQIRGISTLSSNSSPLIVIDGFPTSQSLSSLDPKDVASITVLKDAAAASIWGVRASNGVIVITTKSSSSKKDGKILVDFSASTKMGLSPDLDALDWLGADDMVDAQLEAIGLVGVSTYWKTGSSLNALEKLAQLQIQGKITEAEYNSGIEKLRLSDNKNQIGDNLFRKSKTNQYNLAISSTTDKVNNYLSVSYADTDSYYAGNDNQRVTINLKNDYKFNDRFKTFFRVYTNFSKNNSNSTASEYLGGSVMPYDLLVDENGDYLHQGVTYKSKTPWDHDEYEAKGYRSWRYNLLEEQRNADNSTKSISSRIQTGLNYKLFEGVSFDSKFQYEFGNSETRNFYSDETYTVRNLFNYYTEYDEVAGTVSHNWPEGDMLDLYSTRFYSVSFRNQLSLNKTVGEKGQISAIAGGEIQKYYSRNNQERKIGFKEKTGSSVLINFEDFQNRAVGTYHKNKTGMYRPNSTGGHPNAHTFSDSRDISWYGNAGYTYDEKINLTASFRIDQSNLFGTDPKYKYNPLWSVGSSYTISKDDYFKVNWIDYLKVRGTYGFGGNVDRTTSPYLVARYANNFSPRETILRVDTSNPPNPKLRPERTAIFNLGLDFAVLNNRISGSFEYFSKKSTNLLANIEMDPTLGFSNTKINAGSMENTGYDFDISARIIDKEFKWDMDITFGRITNKVTNTEVLTSTSYYLNGTKPIEGYPMGSLFAIDYLRLNEVGDPVVRGADGVEIASADFSAGMISPDDLVYMGTTVPKVAGGGSTEFQYKGISLALDFTYKFGHKMRMPTPSLYPRYLQQANNHSDLAYRWKEAGDEMNTMVPKMSSRYTNEYLYKNGSINVDDASYVKLRHVTLKYKFPKRLIDRYSLKRLELKLQVSNVAYWAANKKDYDPDYVRGDRFILPAPKTVSLGLNVQF